MIDDLRHEPNAEDVWQAVSQWRQAASEMFLANAPESPTADAIFRRLRPDDSDCNRRARRREVWAYFRKLHDGLDPGPVVVCRVHGKWKLMDGMKRAACWLALARPIPAVEA